MEYIEVSGAYGRDYKSGKAMKEDWAAGKDFIILTWGKDEGRYINNADAAKDANLVVQGRFKQLTGLVTLHGKG